MQGNYGVILSRDWIHVNRCIPSTLHQFLIQWIDDEVEVVHTDASAYIALANVMVDWQHGSTQCLSRKDLTGYDFLASPGMDLCPCLCTRLLELGSDV
jgi:hypothetical protein